MAESQMVPPPDGMPPPSRMDGMPPPPPPPGMDGMPPPPPHGMPPPPHGMDGMPPHHPHGFPPPPPPEQGNAMHICIRVTAGLSLLCSCYIAYSIIRNPRKRSLPKERIILGLSCSDIIFSFFFFLGNWPLPRSEHRGHGAFGNDFTCQLQGFFIQLGIMSPMYNGFLALYLFFYVCREWTRQVMKKIEIWGHIFVFAFSLAIAIAGLGMELYNVSPVVCWIAPYPFHCTQSYKIIDGTSTDCTRGDNADIYRLAFYYGIIWVNIFLTFFSFLLIYLHMRNQEKRMEAYLREYATNNTMTTSNSRNNNSSSDSKKIALRGVLYTVAFLITWLPGTVAESMRVGIDREPLEERVPFFFVVIFTALTPSQGIFNFFIYIQPAASRYLNERKRRRIAKMDMKEDHNDQKDQGDQFAGERKEPFSRETMTSTATGDFTLSTTKGELASSTATIEPIEESTVTAQLKGSSVISETITMESTIKEEQTPSTFVSETIAMESTITGEPASSIFVNETITMESTITGEPVPSIGTGQLTTTPSGTVA